MTRYIHLVRQQVLPENVEAVEAMCIYNIHTYPPTHPPTHTYGHMIYLQAILLLTRLIHVCAMTYLADAPSHSISRCFYRQGIAGCPKKMWPEHVLPVLAAICLHVYMYIYMCVYIYIYVCTYIYAQNECSEMFIWVF